MEPNDPFLTDLRHLISVSAGVLLAKGVIGAEWVPVIISAATIVLNLWWARWTKAKQQQETARAVNIALASPPDTPPAAVMEAAKEIK